jgi:hypothetical protein
MDAHDLGLWLKSHLAYTYRCGLLQLGGGSGELSDKRYTDKVCRDCATRRYFTSLARTATATLPTTLERT